MKKYISSIIIPVLLVGLFITSCSENNTFEEFDYQSIAWASLSSEEQATINHDVKDAVVKFNDEYMDWTVQDADPVPAVSVRFNTKNDSLLGPIIVYISPKTKKILGFAPRF